MTDIAIRVENLSKQYRIGAKQESYRTLRDTLAGMAAGPVRALQSLAGHGAQDEARSFWALKDVSFEVKRGEVVGIIGRNGAGKSTLLKILSRMTEPTSGHADIYGRVASLLEVGTGFHPELTGRENIFLNGAILGMKREEIRRKFDEIVAFAEVEQFVDTPVKHYSSGMYLRLAFAVAAHLEPEILVVDEVLAVGDAQFQKKCLGKMGEVAKEGRTVLFVSHSMQAIKRLCTTAVVLNRGELVESGEASVVVTHYLAEGMKSVVNSDITREMHRIDPKDVEIVGLELLGCQGSRVESLMMDEDFVIRIHCKMISFMYGYRVGVEISRIDGIGVFSMWNNDAIGDSYSIFDGIITIEVKSKNMLLPGEYVMKVAVKRKPHETVDIVEGVRFSVADVSVTSDDIRVLSKEFIVKSNGVWSINQFQGNDYGKSC
jgi:lipopolysaccharide transport system ATP-binding protein